MIRLASLMLFCTALVLSMNTSCSKKGKNNNATDTLAYELKTLTTTHNNCNIDSPECTYITYSYPVFRSGQASADSLNEYVRFILGERTGGNTLQQTQDNFISDYLRMTGDSDTAAAWYSQTRIDVPYQHNKIVSVKIEMDDYTGGPYSQLQTTYQVFDKTDNKVLIQTGLVKKDKAQELLTIAEKAFRKDSELDEATDLEKAGYWFTDNSFYLTENYCVTSDGITWLYNPGEIAPYSQGTIELFLDKEDLLPFINESYTDIWD